MKVHHIIGLLLVTMASSAQAIDTLTSQWKIVGLSLFDLVQTGYSVVAVTSDMRGDSSVETFILQKNQGLFKCFEIHTTDVKARESAALFNCFELVKPYTPPRIK